MAYLTGFGFGEVHAAIFIPLACKHGADELVPLRHAGALLRHVVPMIVVLGAHILQRMVLEAVADLLGNAGFAGQGLERPPEVAVRRAGDPAAVPLTPDEAIERAVAYRPRHLWQKGRTSRIRLA